MAVSGLHYFMGRERLTRWSTRSICKGGFILSTVSSGSEFKSCHVLAICDWTLSKEQETHGMNPWKLKSDVTEPTNSHESFMKIDVEIRHVQMIVTNAKGVLGNHISSKRAECHVEPKFFPGFLVFRDVFA